MPHTCALHVCSEAPAQYRSNVSYLQCSNGLGLLFCPLWFASSGYQSILP